MRKPIIISLLLLFPLILPLSACSSFSGEDVEAQYPKDPADVRRERHGKLTGEGGLKLFGGEDGAGSGGASLGINSFLWRAALDTLSFMPLKAVDPRGGVIITDWYESPNVKGERFKMDVVIMDTRLRTDALRVSVFKQVLKNGDWRDVLAEETVARELEDKILTRARELRIGAAR